MLEMGDRREGVPPEDAAAACEVRHGGTVAQAGRASAPTSCARAACCRPSRSWSALVRPGRGRRAAFRHQARLCLGRQLGQSRADGSRRRARCRRASTICASVRRSCAARTASPAARCPAMTSGAFTLEAELVEIKTKHSLPDGETGRDAFGNRLTFEDRGARLRGIVNLGRVDIQPGGPDGASPRRRDRHGVERPSDRRYHRSRRNSRSATRSASTWTTARWCRRCCRPTSKNSSPAARASRRGRSAAPDRRRLAP